MAGLAKALLAACIVLSGCAESSAVKATSPADPSARPAEVDANTGAIDGTVFDEELRPIPGAQIAILQTDLATVADAAGRFTFSRLAPGKVPLTASALGYESIVRPLEVVAGEVALVQLLLVPLPIVEARVASFSSNGYWNCQVHAGAAILQCGVAGVTAAGLKNSFNYPVDAGVTTILQEMTWKPASAFTQPSKGQLFFGSRDSKDKFTLHGYLTSAPPVALRIVPGEAFPTTGWTEFTAGAGKTAPTDIAQGNMQSRPVAYFEVGDAGTGLIYEQKFTFYVSVAYVEPLDDRYTAIPDG